MNKTVFDAESFVAVDLSRGRIASRRDERMSLISEEIIQLLPPGDALHEAAAKWGGRHGTGLETVLASGDAGIEALAEHLGGTLAALGLGSVRIEIRRDALLFRSSTTPWS